MLRLQAPLADRYTLATPAELEAMDPRRQGHPRRPAADPRPPLPAARGHPLGRPARRLVQARPVRRRQRPGHRHRLLRRPLHGRGGRHPHRRPPARDPPRPQRRLLDGRHGRHRPGRGVLGRRSPQVTDIERIVPDHLHELLGRAEGVRRRPRRRGLHVVERPGRPRVGLRQRARRRRSSSSPTSTSAATPASRWATTSPTCAVWNPHLELGGLDERDVKEADVPAVEGPLHRAPALRSPSTSRQFRAEHPDGEVIVHPECRHEVVELADRVGLHRAHHRVGHRRARRRRCSASAPRSTWRSAWRPRTPTRRSCRSTRSICPCSTMFRIDEPHLASCLESLVRGEVVNQIVVDDDTAEVGARRPPAHARHHLTRQTRPPRPATCPATTRHDPSRPARF